MSFFDLFRRLRRSASDICGSDSPQKAQKNGGNEQRRRSSDYPNDSGGLTMSATRASGRHKSRNKLAFGPSLNDSMMTMAATSTSGANQMNNSRSAMSVGYFGDLKRSRSSYSATYNSNSLNNSKATSNTNNTDAICDPSNDDLMISSKMSREYEVNIGSVEIWDKRLASDLLSQQSFLDLAGGKGLCQHFKKRFEAVNFKKLGSLLNHDYSIMCCDNLSIIYETEREAYYSSLESGRKYVPKNFASDSKSLLVCFECAKILCQGIRTPNHFHSHTSLIKHHCFIDCLFKRIFCKKCGWLEISLCSGSYANFFDLFFNLFRDYLFPERKISSLSLLDSLQTSFSGSFHDRSFKMSSNHSASQLSTSTTTATSLPRRTTNRGLSRGETSKFSIAVEFTFPPKLRLKNLNAICSGTSPAAGATHEMLALQRSCTENLINNSHKFYDELANPENNGAAPEDGDIGELKSVIGLIRYKSSSESEYRNIMLPVIQSLIRMPFFNQTLIELWKSGILCKVIFKPKRSRSSLRYQSTARWLGELDVLISINITNDATIKSYLNIISNYSNSNPEKVKKNINHIWATVSDSLSSQCDYDSDIGFAGQIARPGLLLNAIFQLLRSKILKYLFKILSLATSNDFSDSQDSYDIDSSPHWPLDQIFTLPNNFLREMKSESSPDYAANHQIAKLAREETSDTSVNDYIVRVNRCVMPKACDSCLAKVNCDADLADENSQSPAYDNNLVMLSKSQDYLMPGPNLSVSKDNIQHLKNDNQNMDKPESPEAGQNGRVMSEQQWRCYSLAALVRNILIATSGQQQQERIGEDEERSKTNNSNLSSESHHTDFKWIYMILDVDGCLQDSPHPFNLQHSFEIALDITEPSGYANPNRNNCEQLRDLSRSHQKPLAQSMPEIETKKRQPSLRMRVSSVIYRDEHQRWNCAIYTSDLQKVVVTCGKRVTMYPIGEFSEQKMPSDCISVIVLRRELPPSH